MSTPVAIRRTTAWEVARAAILAQLHGPARSPRGHFVPTVTKIAIEGQEFNVNTGPILKSLGAVDLGDGYYRLPEKGNAA